MFKRSLKNYSLTRISTNQMPNPHEFIRGNSIKIRENSCKKDFFSVLNKRGVVLLIVLGTLLVVVSLATVILSLILSHARLTHHQTSRIQAYYATLAGVNYAIEKLRVGNDANWPATGSYTRYLCRSGCSGTGDVNDPELPNSIQQVEITVGSPGTGISGTRPISAKATYTYTP